MIIRNAETADIPQLTSMFAAVTQRLHDAGVDIWDEVYPACTFEDDIANKRLFVLDDDGVPAAAFALLENADDSGIIWDYSGTNTAYLYRLAVNVAYAHTGTGTAALNAALDIAKQNGAESMRLLAAVCNTPAAAFYLKQGFTQAAGIHNEPLTDGEILKEYGYERIV